MRERRNLQVIDMHKWISFFRQMRYNVSSEYRPLKASLYRPLVRDVRHNQSRQHYR